MICRQLNIKNFKKLLFNAIVTNCTSLHIRHSFPRLRQAAPAAVPTTYERYIGKDRSASADIMEKVYIPPPWLNCLSVCRRRKRRCARLFHSRSLTDWYQKGHVAIFSFLVTLACENDSSHFPLFSSILRYNACVFNCSKF